MKRSTTFLGGAFLALLPLGVLLTGCGSGNGGGLIGGNATATPTGIATATPTAVGTTTPTSTSIPGGHNNAFNATFSANSSNISTAPFNNSASNGVFSVVGNLRTLSGSFIQVVGTSPRTITITLTKPGAFAVNDTFPIEATNTDQLASVGYSEGAGATTKAFSGVSGTSATAKITAISGANVSITITDVVMNVADGNGLPNTATGQFTLSGNGTITAQTNVS